MPHPTLAELESTVSSFWRLLVDRSRVTWLLVLGLLVWGLASFATIPRETQPQVSFQQATVTTVWPGASPTDVERLVTDVIEREVDTLDDVKRYTSTSQSGVSVIVIEYVIGTDQPENMQALKDAVDDATRDLPDSLPDDPQVSEFSLSDLPVISYALSGDFSWSELGRFADLIEDELESVPDVKDVLVKGAPDEEVHIFLDPVELQARSLSSSTVIQALQAQHRDLPLGTIKTNQQTIEISLEGELSTVAEMSDLPIITPTATYRLGEVATIRPEYAEFNVETYYTAYPDTLKPVTPPASGVQRLINYFAQDQENYSQKKATLIPAQPSVSIEVIKGAEGGNVLTMVSDIESRLLQLKTDGRLPESLALSKTFDRAQEIGDSLGVLLDNGGATLILIGLIMLLALGFKESLLSSVAVPLSLLTAIGYMNAIGRTFNGISLFALVLSVGLLVDVAIIMVEGISEAVTEGQSPRQAALSTIRTFRAPVVTGTLTTIFAFLPMLFFVTGINGQFISIIPITVTAVLTAALVVSLWVLPSLGVSLYSTDQSTFAGRTGTLGWAKRTGGLLQRLFGSVFTYRGGLPWLLVLGLTTLLAAFISLTQGVLALDISLTEITLTQLQAATPTRQTLLSLTFQLLFLGTALAALFVPTRVERWLSATPVRGWCSWASLRQFFGHVFHAWAWYGMTPHNALHRLLAVLRWVALLVVSMYLFTVGHILWLIEYELLRFLLLTVIFLVDRALGRPLAHWVESVLYDRAQPILPRIRDWYEPHLATILATPRYYVGAIIASIVTLLASFALFPLGLLNFEIFPSTDQPLFVAKVTLPTGTPIAQTRALVPVIDAALQPYFPPRPDTGDQWLDNVVYTVGKGSDAIQDFDNVGAQSEPHVLGITLNLTEDDFRTTPSYLIADLVEESIQSVLPEYATYRTIEQQGGPPVGAPIELRITGRDLDRSQATARQLVTALEGIDGLQQVRDSIPDQTLKLIWQWDRDQLAEYGLTPAQVLSELRSAVAGSTALQLTNGTEETDVKARIDWAGLTDWRDPDSLDIVAQVPLTAPDGRVVPFGDVATAELTQQVSLLTHRDGQRVFYVRADLTEGTTADMVTPQLREAISKLEILPGESVTLGGETEESFALVGEMLSAMGFAALLILVVLVWQFGSFRLSGVVLLMVPLSLTGVFFGFALMGVPLSFPSLIGIVSLAGIIVNDDIVVIDRAMYWLDQGQTRVQAFVRAASERLQPVFLTSITTVLGMLPLSLSDEVWGGLGFAIVYGMALSTVLTLLLTPCYLMLTGIGAESHPADSSQTPPTPPQPALTPRSAPHGNKLSKFN